MVWHPVSCWVWHGLVVREMPRGCFSSGKTTRKQHLHPHIVVVVEVQQTPCWNDTSKNFTFLNNQKLTKNFGHWCCENMLDIKSHHSLRGVNHTICNWKSSSQTTKIYLTPSIGINFWMEIIRKPLSYDKYKWNVNVYNIWQSLWWKRNDCWYRNSESDALLSAFPFSISYQMVWAPLVFYHWMNEGQGTPHLLLHMHHRKKRPFFDGKCHFHIISFDWKHQRCQTDMTEDTFGK